MGLILRLGGVYETRGDSKHLAELLHRSEKGLDYTLTHPSESAFAESLHRMKLRLGRLIYFRATDVAVLLAGAE
uniref:hypothetical protein n=1 Tax=Pseudomonas lundensis TaxID=86185 RepID=UPI001D031743